MKHNDNCDRQDRNYMSSSQLSGQPFIWTIQDELKLTNTVKCIGRDWNQIQRVYFKNLTPRQLKNKFYNIRRRKNDNSSVEPPPTIVTQPSQTESNQNNQNVEQLLSQLLDIVKRQ